MKIVVAAMALLSIFSTGTSAIELSGILRIAAEDARSTPSTAGPFIPRPRETTAY